MLDREKLARTAAAFKRDAQRAFDEAVKALIDLAWSEKTPTIDFLWESDPELDAKANAILRGLSDTLAQKAKDLAAELIRNSIEPDDAEPYDIDAIWDKATENDGIGVLFRFDMAGSHLKELLEIWIALAILNDIQKSELRVLISRYLNNPFASPLWRGIPRDILRWGRGYDKNILEQLAVIGQNSIIGAGRYAEWEDARRKGAQYYIRHRGSYYDCPDCDSLCGYPIPIDEPFEWLHSRCMCWPEYFFEPMP